MLEEKFDFEAKIHLIFHGLMAVVMMVALILLPLTWAFLLLFVEFLQIKLLGNCVLTVLAHKRGYMRGLSYWAYVAKLLGIKNYQRANLVLAGILNGSAVAVLVFRLGRSLGYF